jgi:hypothetical protein
MFKLPTVTHEHNLELVPAGFGYLQHPAGFGEVVAGNRKNDCFHLLLLSKSHGVDALQVVISSLMFLSVPEGPWEQNQYT